MQYARIHMAKHAIAEVMTVQQRTEFHNIVRQIFWWYAGIFNKWDWFGCAFGISQQPHCFFTHTVNAFNTRYIVTNLITNNTALAFSHQYIQAFTQRGNPLFNQCLIIARELHQVQTQHLFARYIGN